MTVSDRPGLTFPADLARHTPHLTRQHTDRHASPERIRDGPAAVGSNRYSSRGRSAPSGGLPAERRGACCDTRRGTSGDEVFGVRVTRRTGRAAARTGVADVGPLNTRSRGIGLYSYFVTTYTLSMSALRYTTTAHQTNGCLYRCIISRSHWRFASKSGLPTSSPMIDEIMTD